MLDKTKNLLLLLVSILLVFAALEATFRVRAYLKWGTASYLPDEFFEKDAKTGLRKVRSSLEHRNIQTNAKGFRGPDPEIPKPERTLRLAFLGASTTFCFEVGSEEYTWPYLVWKSVQEAHPDITVDYINAAVPGFRIVASLKNLEENVAAYRPDVVFVYHATNDLADITRKLAASKGVTTISLDRPSWLAKQSILYYLLEKNIRLALRRHGQQDGDPRFVFSAEYYAPEFGARLESLIDAAKRVAPLVVVPTFSYRCRREQSHEELRASTESGQIYMPFLSAGQLLASYEAFNHQIEEVSKRSGALLIPNELVIPGNSVFFVDTVHFSREGAAEMANRVSEVLLESVEFQKLVAQKRAIPNG